MDSAPIRVVLIDDQELSRLGIRLALESDPGIAVVGEADTGCGAIDLIASESPDVALMDIRMPDLDGIEATRRIIAGGATTRVLVLTTFELDEYALSAVSAGASGFIGKSTDPAGLIRAVRSVAGGDAVLSPTATRAVIAALAGTAVSRQGSELPPDLTPREVEVLTAIGRGLSNAEIAAEFVVSAETVKTHVKRVFAKTGARDRVQAVILAYRCGLVMPGE
ncbi:response regulator transcription factor [Cellulomonas sp. NPDC089187]|uniref:response regulator transcription factor n=1 Tax=Cellulomonas sp. NPDC089187 TaxID=3154970 RepID=UPI00341F9E65